MKKEQVLIVGGGFGGIKAALELASNAHFHVTLLTINEDFRYYPTLYRTATGGRRSNTSIPIKEIFKNHRINVKHGDAVSLDRKTKQITDSKGNIYRYDTLILALGTVTNYFSIPGLEEHAFSIKSNDEAIRFKNHLHQQLTDENQPDLNYLIVGGGPTGVELAGALPAYLNGIMHKHGIIKNKINVHLIEATPRLLPVLPKSTSRVVKRRLKKLGVKVHTGMVVQGETADELKVGGKKLRSHTVVWTAGVANNPFFANNNFILMNRGKVATDVYLQSEPDIFILGDNANTPYSGLAQTAVHDGTFVAKNLKRRARGKSFKAYKPKTPVAAIPVGYLFAVVVYKKLRIHGWPGWLLREAADFVAFNDLEAWPKAAQQWITGLGAEEDCPECQNFKFD